METKISVCEAEIMKAASDYVRLQTLMAQKTAMESDLEAKTERWLYLNKLAEKIIEQAGN